MTVWPHHTGSLTELFGFALLHSVWQIVVIALVVAWLLRQSSVALIRYRIAYGGLVAMVLAPTVCFMALAASVPSRPSTVASASDPGATSIQPTESSARPEDASPRAIADPSGTAPSRTVSSDTVLADRDRTGVDGISAGPIREEVVLAPASSSVSASISGTRLANPRLAQRDQVVSSLGLLWLIGVLFLSGRRAGGWLMAHRTVHRSRPVDDQGVLDRVAELSRRVGMSTPARILQSERVHTPMVIGVIRPCILVPVAFLTGLTPDQQSAILAHELAHLRRNDFLQNLIQTGIETVLFYHPATWWLSSQIRSLREDLCDDWSVSVVGKPICLVEALSFIHSTRKTNRAIAFGQAAEGNGAHDTIRRARRILGSKSDRQAENESCSAGVTRWSRTRCAPVRGLSLLLFVASASTLVFLAPALAPALAVAMQDADTSGTASSDAGTSLPGTTDGDSNDGDSTDVGAAEPKIESWEISRLYEPAFYGITCVTTRFCPNRLRFHRFGDAFRTPMAIRLSTHRSFRIRPDIG